MEIKYESIFDCEEDIIIHQVNCQGAFGAGIASQVAKLYPQVKKEYVDYVKACKIENNYDTSSMLGDVLIVSVDGDKKYIANIFGQNFYGSDGEIYTNRTALIAGIKDVAEFAKESNLSIAIPAKIGCALGGENWNVIRKKIEKIFDNSDVTAKFYCYNPKMNTK